MGSRLRTVALLVCALLGAGTVAAVAQVGGGPGPGDPAGTTTTSTTAPPETTTTTAGPIPNPFPTSTSVPPSTTTTAPTTSPTVPGGGGGDGVLPPGTPQVVPPEYQSIIGSVKRSKANNTDKLLEALRPLEDLGLSQEQAIAEGFGRFPVGGSARFSHDWWFPRFVPTFHLHEGTDIFAAFGTPVRAPADGVLKQSNGPVGGMASYVTMADGTYFYMAHLSAYPPEQVTGQAVKTGDIVGYVGDSGNAQGGSPHLHFEVHPAPTKVVTQGRGKKKTTQVVTVPVKPGTELPPSDPKPYLDLWITEALANIPKVIARHEANRPQVIITTGLTRRLADGRSGVFASPTTPPRSQLLWASSASPSGGGALRLAEAEALEAAQDVDWDQRARDQAARTAAFTRADSQARLVLAPLTPRALRAMLGLA